MAVCVRCGQDNPDGFRVCGMCGSELVHAASTAVQVRKTVSIVFADVVGSTALGERVDPESMRNAMSRYFEVIREVIERHGGTVEKFVGDAVMAVFGIPELHEDDALRAVRAAEEMRTRLAQLDLGLTIEMRTGVNTGEVVAGEGETFATGDAVNVAARLEQAAAPGEILLGPATQRLVAAAIRSEEVEPLVLKGKSEPLPAFRLLEVLPDAPAYTRRIDAPFVGRARELGRLHDALNEAIAEGACRMAVVTGTAGVGKSRLLRELATSAGPGVRFLVGRCLSYGEGITYWPLRDVVHQLTGDNPEAELTRLLAGDTTAAAAVAGAVGLTPGAAQSGEIHWSVRKLLETVASEQPLLLVLDDLHWAESTFLDLVDYLAGFVRDAPLLIVAAGRPELLDARPEWRAQCIALESLDERDASALVDELAAGLPEDVRRRVVDAAEGNPLFVEQLVALAAEGGGAVEVPPTIQALLSARIDRLTAEERSVAECGAVEGRLFHRGAVTELAPAAVRPHATTHLLSLVRRDLVRPDQSLFAGDDGFRFGHALIRDAAYAAAPKALRSELHEHYVEWLERVSGDRISELEEIVGYHLEQAYRLGVEVGRPRHDLAERAGRLLGAAGRRALSRGDVAAGLGLLERALAVLDESATGRPELTAWLATACMQSGDLARGLEIAEGGRAGAAGPVAVAQSLVVELEIKLLTSQVSVAEVLEALGPAMKAFEDADDHAWQARAWLLVASTGNVTARLGDMVQPLRRALDHASIAGEASSRAEALFWLGATIAIGPTPVQDALEQMAALRELSQTRLEHAYLDVPLAFLMALAGDMDEARRFGHAGRGFFREIGNALVYAGTSFVTGHVEMFARDFAAAEREYRAGYETLLAAGEQGYRSSVAVGLAQSLLAQGRENEAEGFAHEAAEIAAADDVLSQSGWRLASAQVLARRGEDEEALRLAQEGVSIARTSDAPTHQAEALLALAEVHRLGGRAPECGDAVAAAVELFEGKGATALADQARTHLLR
jgi:class 3 adenylate cyclase/tetratricopeptide (TPR) repeat protein